MQLTDIEEKILVTQQLKQGYIKRYAAMCIFVYIRIIIIIIQTKVKQ